MNLLREKLRCTPMGAGLRFGGDSSTSSTTYQQDNRRVIGDGGISAEDSNVSSTVLNVSTDFGAVDAGRAVTGHAMNVVGDVADLSITGNVDVTTTALQYGDRALDTAFNFGGDTVNRTLQSVDRTVDGAFGFGGDALAGALQFGAGAMTRLTDIASESIGASRASAKEANALARTGLDTASDTFGNALLFGGRLTTQAFDAAADTQSFVKDAYADAKGRGALTDKILIGAVIAMAVVAVAVGGKRG